MVNKIKGLLDKFVGKNVNVAEVGLTGGYCCLEGFSWSIVDTDDGELLMLEDGNENKHKYINLDYIDNINVDEFLQQAVMYVENGYQIKIWTDL